MCVKTRSTPASLPFRGQVTKSTTVKRSNSLERVADHLFITILVSEYLNQAVKKFKEGAENMQSLIENVDTSK